MTYEEIIARRRLETRDKIAALLAEVKESAEEALVALGTVESPGSVFPYGSVTCVIGLGRELAALRAQNLLLSRMSSEFECQNAG